MNRQTRRAFGRIAGLSALAALSACGVNSAAMDAQVLADASGAVNALIGAVPSISTAAPTLLPSGVATKILGYLTLARTALGGISTATPVVAGATTLQQVEGYINQAAAGLGAVLTPAAAAIPALAPYVVVVQAALALLPGIIAFVNTILGTSGAPLRAPTMSPEAARALLGIPTITPAPAPTLSVLGAKLL